MEKIFYKLNQEAENTIIELKKKCEELDLGNISFCYYADGTNSKNNVNFYITEYKTYWELIVKQEQRDINRLYWSMADVYKIKDNKIEYDYSEKDLM